MASVMSRCLIFGGSGFIGTHLINILRDSGRYAIESPRTDEVNIRNSSAVMDCVSRHVPSIILNLAGISTVHHGDERDLYAVNTLGHANVIEAASSLSRPVKVILASSAQIYGIQERRALNEDETPRPINQYGVSKLLAERITRLKVEHIVGCSVRMFNCVGRGQAEHFLIPKIIRHFRERAPIIELGGDFERDFVDVRDLCEMWRLVIEAEAPPPAVNFSNGETVSLAEILSQLTEITGHHIGVQRSPQLARKNEIVYQCGDNSTIGRLGYRRRYSLRDTLEWMLNIG